MATYDLYLSFTGGRSLEILEQQHGSPRAAPLYCAVDTDHHRPADAPVPPDQRLALGYMGTFSPDRQGGVEELLLAPARKRPQERFALVGPQYPDDLDLPGNVSRTEHLPPADHPHFYHRQRFTLNLTRADMRALGHAPSVRLFEAAACGTAVLSDRWPGIEELLEPGREIELVDTAADVAAHLDRPAADADAIGRAARKRILASHTAAHRARDLEQALAAIGVPGLAEVPTG